ncbi:hypothetical protein DPMN_183135 [Dreissena polymorpha]|uniref:Uncharacterized protein n=1 Tax=Dreissena polymorpha TaxID=45954 RepID=A0A9D4DGM9_DREPO|nr:hypothetical protein DPMN_183135 [Dreissena polymorpha]
MPTTALQEPHNISAISRQTDMPTTASQEAQDATRIYLIEAASVASVLGVLVAILIMYIGVKRRKPKSSASQQNEVTERSPHTIERPHDLGFQNDEFQENQHEQIITSDGKDDGYLEVTMATNMAKYNMLN